MSFVDSEQIIENLSMPIVNNGRYSNPWSTWKDPGFLDLLNYGLLTEDFKNIPNKEELDKTLPLHKITDNEIKEFCKSNTDEKIKVIWIGHASSLVNIENKIILMDPVFTQKRKRYIDVPITIEKIPRIDAVLISHNHYDHLDQQSIIDLNRKFGQTGINWFCGLGTKQWFNSIGIYENVHELNWWELKSFRNIDFIFTPTQHWSGRGIFDKNRCLWGSWTMVGVKKRIFFAGDTGYCAVFSEIGRKFGPFDLSFIPIGAYHPRSFLGPQHVDPEQAVKIHLDVKSEKSLAIHWGTFAMGKEFYLAPKEELAKALQKYSLDKESFITVSHGTSYKF